METIKDDLKKLKLDVVNVVDKKLLVDEIEYVCKSNNITQLEIKKDFLSVALEKSTLKEILIHFINKVLDSNAFYLKQKVVALNKFVKKYQKKYRR